MHRLHNNHKIAQNQSKLFDEYQLMRNTIATSKFAFPTYLKPGRRRSFQTYHNKTLKRAQQLLPTSMGKLIYSFN